MWRQVTCYHLDASPRSSDVAPRAATHVAACIFSFNSLPFAPARRSKNLVDVDGRLVHAALTSTLTMPLALRTTKTTLVKG